MKRIPHNKGKFKYSLGNSLSFVPRTCETCGANFTARVWNIERKGGGRFCKKKCNPSYAKKFSSQEKYRRYNLGRYGLTVQSYETLLDSQGGCCAICKQVPTGVGRFGRLVVDHDHKTGSVRGLLCCSCNRGIGWLGDLSERALAASVYLARDLSLESPQRQGQQRSVASTPGSILPTNPTAERPTLPTTKAFLRRRDLSPMEAVMLGLPGEGPRIMKMLDNEDLDL